MTARSPLSALASRCRSNTSRDAGSASAIALSRSRPLRFDRRRRAFASVARSIAFGCDVDRIFRNADLAAPAVAERDAADIGEIDALIRLAVVVKAQRRGKIENVQRDEVAGTAAAPVGDDDEEAIVGRADIEVAGFFAGCAGFLLIIGAVRSRDGVVIQIAAGRGQSIDGDPDASGIGEIAVAEIAENLRRNRFAVD